MKKVIFAVLFVLVMGTIGLAGATPYAYEMGNGSSVDTTGTTSVLEMQASVYNFAGLTFSLDVGQSKKFNFANIWTTESWINDDDLLPGTITAYLDFANPDITQAVGGTSIGFQGGFLWSEQGWTLVWSDPVFVDFGNGGKFKIELSDAKYKVGWWFPMDEDGESIQAKITHLADPVETPVPEPATMLLLGLGLVGLAGIRRMFKK